MATTYTIQSDHGRTTRSPNPWEDHRLPLPSTPNQTSPRTHEQTTPAARKPDTNHTPTISHLPKPSPPTYSNRTQPTQPYTIRSTNATHRPTIPIYRHTTGRQNHTNDKRNHNYSAKTPTLQTRNRRRNHRKTPPRITTDHCCMVPRQPR
jgi:hypothetical protein